MTVDRPPPHGAPPAGREGPGRRADRASAAGTPSLQAFMVCCMEGQDCLGSLWVTQQCFVLAPTSHGWAPLSPFQRAFEPLCNSTVRGVLLLPVLAQEVWGALLSREPPAGRKPRLGQGQPGGTLRGSA